MIGFQSQIFDVKNLPPTAAIGVKTSMSMGGHNHTSYQIFAGTSSLWT
jgi:hypothetical protein